LILFLEFQYFFGVGISILSLVMPKWDVPVEIETVVLGMLPAISLESLFQATRFIVPAIAIIVPAIAIISPGIVSRVRDSEGDAASCQNCASSPYDKWNRHNEITFLFCVMYLPTTLRRFCLHDRTCSSVFQLGRNSFFSPKSGDNGSKNRLNAQFKVVLRYMSLTEAT
jgi:hypothetical protein